MYIFVSKLKEQVKALFDLMMESADIKMPGYPFTNRDAFLGMWFSAYARDDITMLNAALNVDQNPLGSAARKFVPDRQNLYHKRIGLRNPEIQCRCGANESENQKKSWLLP
jgi:argininosuccinate lyase